MKDNVKCCNCGFDGLVEIAQEDCPQCHKEGFLAWKEGEPNEVEEQKSKVSSEPCGRINP